MSDDGVGADGRGGARDQDDVAPAPRSAAEWTTLAVSALVVAALVGAALWEHFRGDVPPGVRIQVAVEPGRAEARDGVSYVPFTVANAGAAPAVDVEIVFEVKRYEETVEESTTLIPFLPVEGTAGGEVATTLDPAAHEIVARVGAFQTP